MREQRMNLTAAAAALLLLTLIALTAINAGAVAEMLRGRVALCLNTLIPSLFGCMVFANLLTDSGAAAWCGMRLRILAKLLHLPPEMLTLFCISQIAGYPVGTLLLRQSAARGVLSPDAAARLSYICFGGGPAFLVGFAGVQMFGSAAAGWWMMGACICANLVLMLIFGRVPYREDAAAVTVRLSPESLTNAVRDAMRSLAGICGTVLLFGVIMQLFSQLGITDDAALLGSRFGIAPQTTRALLAALADITQLPQVMHCGLSYRILLPLCGALLSFGGACVHLQCAALGGSRIRLGKLLGMRLFAALLTALLLLPAGDLIALPAQCGVFAVRSAVPAMGSPVPALLIFCTGFPFLLKKD